MKETAKSLFTGALILLCSFVSNALPLVWRADWPDAKPVETLVHRGTDIELQPLWRINKEIADTNGWTFTTFCQTNAVGPWFGPLPGAFFSHTNDVGAAFYNVMVRAQTPGGAVNYTAFARLRMLDSPGFAPGQLPLPAESIDFAEVVALNAPWLLPGATNDIGAIKVELGSISNSVSTLSAATATNSAAIATLNDTKADKSDATLTERGFGEWTFSPATIVDRGAVRTLYMGIDPETGKGFPAFDDAEYGQIHYGESRDLAETTEQIWHARTETPSEKNITAIRTVLPGYILGPDDTSNPNRDKPLASEAEVEELRTAIVGKADNSDVVHKTGDETIEGVKTFSNGIVSDNDIFNGNGFVTTMGVTLQDVAKGYVGGDSSDDHLIHIRTFADTDLGLPFGDVTIPRAKGMVALTSDIDAAISPTSPVASATLAWQSNGSAIVVSVPAAGTLSATLTGWIEGQSQTALITLPAGASVSPEVKLVGYGTWPTGGQFLASATRVGNNVYVTPVILAN